MREYIGFGEKPAAASYPPDSAFRQSGATGDKLDWPKRHELAESPRRVSPPVQCAVRLSHLI